MISIKGTKSKANGIFSFIFVKFSSFEKKTNRLNIKMKVFVFASFVTFIAIGSTVATNETNSTEIDCEKICEKIDDIIVPHCNGTHIEPEYDDHCGCLLGYRCCPSTCPILAPNCKLGLEFIVNVTDCCGCEAFRCDPCPKRSDPKCIPGCQQKERLSDIMNGCFYGSCKTVCPQMDPIICPSCKVSTSFTNSQFCNCAQQKCVRKLCPPKTELPFKECALRKWAKTECGCDKQYYDMEHFCDAPNKVAAISKCSDKCFKNVVRSGKGPCACDMAECVRISEACEQTFPGWNCPKGSVKVFGSTPCGLDREICVKCGEDDAVMERRRASCDLKCNVMVKGKDANGCPTEHCVKKPCPSVSTAPKNCIAFKSINSSVGDCGCFHWSLGACIVGNGWHVMHQNFYKIHTEKKTWQQAQAICSSHHTRLAVIEDRDEEIAIKSLVRGVYTWIGAKCEKSGGKSSFFWDYGDGRRVPFDLNADLSCTKRFKGDSCDSAIDGIVIKNTHTDDVPENQKRPFICELI